MAERDAAPYAFERRLDRAGRLAWDPEIVGQGVGGSHRNYAQSRLAAGDSLDDVMDGAVSTTGQHGVASIANRLARLLGRIGTRLSAHQFGLNASLAENLQDFPQIRLAPFPPAARPGIEEDGRFTHGN